MRKLHTFLCLVVGALNLFPTPAFAYSRSRGSNTPALFVGGSVLQFDLNQNFTNASVNSLGAAALNELNLARLSWNRLATSTIEFREFGGTAVASADLNDGVNIISFENTDTNNEQVRNIGGTISNVLAVAVFGFQISPDPGKIVSADIIFNPRIDQDSPPRRFGNNTSLGNIVDVQSVFLHELGHAIGADHSGILAATMFPVISTGDFHQRVLSIDDVAFATEAYPELPRVLGTIRGRVTRNGTPVTAAHVVAFDPDKNLFAGAVTDTDGTYLIAGLPSGNYRLVVEPFDGPVTRGNIPTIGNYYPSPDLDFPTAFRGGIASPTIHTVNGATEITGADVAITGNQAAINPNLLARNARIGDVSFSTSRNAVLAAPGEAFNLLILGNNISNTTISKLEISGEGVTVGQVTRFESAGPNPVVGIEAALNIATNAPPGPRMITVSGGNAAAVLPGGLLVDSQQQPDRTIYFPDLTSTSSQFVGLGLTNQGTRPAVLTYTAFENNGSLIQGEGILNPVKRTLPVGAQLSGLAGQIFGISPSETRNGWVEIKTDVEGVNGFYLRGDFTFQMLDGADAVPTAGTEWVLTDVRRNSSGGETEVLINNPGTDTATVTVQLIRQGGASSSQSEKLEPGARLQKTLTNLFGALSGNAEQGFVKISSTKPVIVSSRFQEGLTIFTLNGQLALSSSTALVVPHFAVTNTGVVMNSVLLLVNAGSEPSNVTIDVFDNSGTRVGGQNLVISSNSQQSVDIASILSTPTTEGSIFITASSGILGNIVFASNDKVLAAALPLAGMASLPSKALFAHLATALGFFHGIAVINPAQSGLLTGTIKVFEPNGSLIGQEPFSLSPKQRKIGLIGTNFVAAAAGKAGGYIVVEANGGFSAFSLFGRSDLRFLAAVPPNRLQ
ncbi:MAG: carboxypeptidase regulatory-like domain-containing protein [Acidobacteria bacterium]|nr:carboxypeptidase regulatory-like domain-containing protein [Acidobacteriota bacterium]